MNEQKDNFENSQVIDFLKNLDSRITRIEARLNISDSTDISESESNIPKEKKYNEPDPFESTLGEYWFANFGILILGIGILLLLTRPLENFPLGIPSIIGYGITGLVIYLSYKLRSSFRYISNYLVGTTFILFYFSNLRLFHFGTNSVFTNVTIETILLLGTVAVCIFISSRKKSPYLTALSLTMACATGIIIGNSYLIFLTITLVSVLFVFFHIKYRWTYLLLFGMLISYFTHFIWAINNPFLGNKLEIVSEPNVNLIFLLIYALIYSSGNFLNKNITTENNITISNSLINVLGSFTIFHLISITGLSENLIYYEILFSLVFFIISAIFWIKGKNKYSTSTYSLMAFVALSIAIISNTTVPDVFIYLIWQCILVAAISIWYQSKTLTVTNFLIFLGLFFVYLFSAGAFTIISLSFGIVGLVNARILNWQKQRLTLKTEFMRNTYLAIAFFSIPFTLLKSLPQDYVGLSWLAVAIIYYVLSILLKTFKYRWMAHLTLIATILFVLVFGLANSDETLRIVTIFAIGIVTSIISIMFTKQKMKSGKSDPQAEKV